MNRVCIDIGLERLQFLKFVLLLVGIGKGTNIFCIAINLESLVLYFLYFSYIPSHVPNFPIQSLSPTPGIVSIPKGQCKYE